MQVLEATETTGMIFKRPTPFVVVLDVYADGWMVQYSVDKDADIDRIWKDAHGRAITQDGANSTIELCGGDIISYRLHGGTVGATAFVNTLQTKVFR